MKRIFEAKLQEVDRKFLLRFKVTLNFDTPVVYIIGEDSEQEALNSLSPREVSDLFNNNHEYGKIDFAVSLAKDDELHYPVAKDSDYMNAVAHLIKSLNHVMNPDEQAKQTNKTK